MGSEQRAGDIGIPARLVGVALLLLLPLAGSLAAQERPQLTMELSSELVSQGERITVEIFVPGSDPDELTFTLPTLPERLTLVGEPLLTESRRMVNNTVLSGTLIVVQLEAGSPGRTALPPMRVEGLGMEPVETPERLVEISRDGTAEGVPFDLRWRMEESEVLVGQTVPLYLEMRNLLDLRYPDAITVDSPSSGVFEEVRGLGEVSSRRVEETTLYDVPVAVFLVTPTEEGTVEIPSASVTLGELRRESPALRLSAVTPPTQPDSGAIGRFDFTVDVSQTEGELAGGLSVTMRISGTGNFPFLSFPTVTTENLIELDRGEESRQDPSTDGYAGERSLTLRFSRGEGERASVEVEDFQFYNPDEGRLETVSGESYTYALRGPGSADSPAIERELSLLSVEEILGEEESFSHRESGSYLLFLIGPGILLVIGVSVTVQRRRRSAVIVTALFSSLLSLFPLSGVSERLEEGLARAERLFERGAYAEAVAAYDGLIEEFPWNGALFHNYGVAAYRLGSRGEAVHGFREAVRFDQSDRDRRALLRSVEEEYGLEEQVDVPRFVDPDLALIGLLLFFNLGLPLMVLLPFRAKGQRVIFGTLFLILTRLGGLLFLQAVRIESQARGVVGAESARMLRIPEPDADTWLTLPQGTAVEVELRHQEFVLVRTGLGVEGWLEAEELLLGGAGDG
ncbi:MAG: tetratricopeptide repeat protein [Spirochaetaceae bacterium]